MHPVDSIFPRSICPFCSIERAAGKAGQPGRSTGAPDEGIVAYGHVL